MLAVPEFHQVAAVVATRKLTLVLFVLCAATANNSNAAVLGEDRIDVLYHKYDGGGITIDGPSILVRKSIGNSVSVSANYYIDSISSASIDAITQASAYEEERTQQSLSIDYLYDKSIMTYSYTDSSENDFEAVTNSFNISQEMFGGLTTVSIGYSVGSNTIGQSTNDAFKENASTKNYRFSLSQVLTKNMLMGVTYEIITDTGFLNNPYRQIRYINPTDPTDTDFQDEKYPRTRTSNAVSINLRYYLPYRAAVYGGYRFFTDTWDIEADTYEMGYVHPYKDNWLFDINMRFYSQTKASFFSSLFPFRDPQNFYASDKELSTFTSNSFGAGVTYNLDKEHLYFFEKGSVNLYLDHFNYEYEDFLDTTVSVIEPGTEPAYSFSASVLRFYLSFWF